ncbi:hypothetical protein DICVIV_01608 [Dictyocaulus viviparus]|uniref:Uncharacterized protein n=1 Tax=Dictyocaulus viviparus TaxID=29172 RepID=A0A0D8Y5J3_DICVI|nr:hypothetical protein DICVIV_01608 [Dictyocaulus viviparus]
MCVYSARTTRSVRMDIDLSKLPDNTKVAERRAPSRATSTAFTVNFDSPSEELSLQDAARKSAQARRILSRRSAGGSTTSSTNQLDCERRVELPSSNSSNKRYLLNKLLEGEGQNVDEECAQIKDFDERNECDVSSEAGTYVVDLSSRVGNSSTSQLMSTKIVEDSDASPDTSSSSDTESNGSPIPRRKATISPTKTSSMQEARVSSGRATVSGGELGGEFTKLRKLAGITPTSPADIRNPNSITRNSGSSASSRPGPAVCAQPLRANPARASLGAQPSNRSTMAMQARPGSCSGPMRRGDGGRYSMRGTTPAVVSNTHCTKKPPFRAGAAPIKTIGINTAQQKEQEMNAWLRRKDYNPMKAAAEARKAKELKASQTSLSLSNNSDVEREEQFVSNRSISFHIGPVMPANSTREGFLEITRNRSQESLAVAEAEQASQRVLAEYSRGVVKNISRLSQQSSKAAGKQLSSLARTVDILSQKCKKSIELIRSQNKGCLSVSVEDLLATASEPPRKGETLNEQLDRLSNAFDAVQRYLEQYSLDGHESPISGFTDDALEVQSSASSFSKKKFHL